VIRGVAATLAIIAVPWTSMFISQGVTAVSSAILADSQGNLDKAISGAMQAFSCESESQKATLAAVGMGDSVDAAKSAGDNGFFGETWQFYKSAIMKLQFMLSPAGVVLFLARLAGYLLIVLKFVILDVLWPIMFTVVVYLGVITIPITFLKEMGGLAQYARQVAAIAMWPIVFAFLVSLVAATFPETLKRVSSGQPAAYCRVLITIAAAKGADVSPQDNPVTGPISGLLDAMKFLAICIGIGFMLLKTPAICAAMVGVQDPSHGFIGWAGSVASSVAKKAVTKGAA